MKRLTWEQLDYWRFISRCWLVWLGLCFVVFLWCCPGARFPLPDRAQQGLEMLEELPPVLVR